MVTLVWRTDVHISDKPPVSRTDDWVETVLEKLAEVGEIAREADACAVIDGGDFFDRKSPFLTSHRLIRKVAETHTNYPCPVYSIVGNHDCVYSDIEYLPQQPLGVLFSTGVFQRLYDEHEAVFECDGVKVRVVGVPYHGVEYDMSRLAVKKRDEDFLVVAAHLLASPQGGQMFEAEDIVRYSDLESLDADCFLFGHWHKNQGVTEIIDGKWVVNVGSLTRGTISQDDLSRSPTCVVLKFSQSGLEFDTRKLKVKFANEVFDLDRRAKAASREMLVDDFVDSVKTSLAETQAESIKDKIRNMKDAPSPVKERAILIWEGTG